MSKLVGDRCHIKAVFRCACAAVCVVLPSFADVDADPAGGANPSNYIFAWPFVDQASMLPRGGNTKGPQVLLSDAPSVHWQSRSNLNLSPIERDRQAILGMAGGYRVSFDFMEIVGFAPNFKPAQPYRSWGVEYVEVIANEPAFISLQHILVLRHQLSSGDLSPPIVMKHWRQDWRYEDTVMIEYMGESTWQRIELPPDRVVGRWTQAVYQVDDSPRYESFGRWHHNSEFSSWHSEATSRPLPRREFSTRDDYHSLLGTNRHTVLPLGWLHEQENFKVRTLVDVNQYIARELGVNRYERIEGYDFSPGHTYWRSTSEFWQQVRQTWIRVFNNQVRFSIRKVDGESLARRMLSLAEQYRDSETYDPASAQHEINTLFEMHISAEKHR